MNVEITIEKIVDEAIESVPTDVSAYDLMGITVDTFTSIRAYRIADGLRTEKTGIKRKIPERYPLIMTSTPPF